MDDISSPRWWIIFLATEAIAAGVLWLIGLLSPWMLIISGIAVLLALLSFDHGTALLPGKWGSLLKWGSPPMLLCAVAVVAAVISSHEKNEKPATAVSKAGARQLPTLQQLFLTDFLNKGSGGGLVMSIGGFTEINFHDGGKAHVFYIVTRDFGSRSQFLSLYVPQSPYTLSALLNLAASYHDYLNLPLQATATNQGETSGTSSSELVFTGRIFIYHERDLSLAELSQLDKAFRDSGANPEFRSKQYLMAVWDNIQSGRIKPPPRIMEMPGHAVRVDLPREVGPSKSDQAATTILQKPMKRLISYENSMSFDFCPGTSVTQCEKAVSFTIKNSGDDPLNIRFRGGSISVDGKVGMVCKAQNFIYIGKEQSVQINCEPVGQPIILTNDNKEMRLSTVVEYDTIPPTGRRVSERVLSAPIVHSTPTSGVGVGAPNIVSDKER